MAQITTGIRSFLSHPFFYNLVQNSLGVRKARKTLVNEYFPAEKGISVLDIGCGTAEILEFLPDDIDYTGFDASPAYIEQAIKRYGNRGHFFAGLVEATQLENMEPFDVILAFGVLHHLDDSHAEQLFSMAAKAIKPDGVVLTVDPCFTPNQPSFARWLIKNDRGQNVRDEAGYQNLATKHFARIKSKPHHDLLHVPYTYLIMSCGQATDIA
ncbi:MAG TPA: class I SAM-dependent methyltransferase [Mariprofundaceae bacterium]|nr:class I SAM-dependent methyltransferase [Mariprofundaceae bacterium]